MQRGRVNFLITLALFGFSLCGLMFSLLGLGISVRAEEAELPTDISKMRAELAETPKPVIAEAAQVAKIPVPAPENLNVPIIIYHKTPANFEVQLLHLKNNGYSTITLNELTATLNGKATLPAKAVVLTFDDGFADNMAALELLKKHSLKATLFLSTGGEASSWCIGANRTNTTCGDSYLTWDQVKQMDASGVFTVGAHTVDHLSLVTLNAEALNFQIRQSKAEIEAKLGHPITNFAYPYGTYNSTVIKAVQEAGFLNAVSTRPGTIHTPGENYYLKRARDVFSLK